MRELKDNRGGGRGKRREGEKKSIFVVHNFSSATMELKLGYFMFPKLNSIRDIRREEEEVNKEIVHEGAFIVQEWGCTLGRRDGFLE